MAEHFPQQYTSPVYQALLSPPLWNGVPRKFGLLNLTLGVGIVIGLHWLWYIPIALAIHYGARLATKYDPFWMTIVVRNLRYYDYYEG